MDGSVMCGIIFRDGVVNLGIPIPDLVHRSGVVAHTLIPELGSFSERHFQVATSWLLASSWAAMDQGQGNLGVKKLLNSKSIGQLLVQRPYLPYTYLPIYSTKTRVIDL